jgi:hypothetical protein
VALPAQGRIPEHSQSARINLNSFKLMHTLGRPLRSGRGSRIPATAVLQQRLGWRPTGPGLIDDLDHMRYFEA